MATSLEHNGTPWSELNLAVKWIQQTATILDNEEQLPRLLVQQRFGAWMISMSDQKQELGSLADWITSLLKVTRNYWSGLFHCYQVENLPKTNNDLEQVFGSFRHHTRRTTGRKKAAGSMIIRGSARLIAAIATKIKTFTAKDLAMADLGIWREQRSSLESLRQTRIQQRHFRHDPDNYLRQLETKLLQSILPL